MTAPKHGEQGCPGCELLEGMLEKAEAKGAERSLREVVDYVSALAEFSPDSMPHLDASQMRAVRTCLSIMRQQLLAGAHVDTMH